MNRYNINNILIFKTNLFEALRDKISMKLKLYYEKKPLNFLINF
jgi:hypothetical protein